MKCPPWNWKELRNTLSEAEFLCSLLCSSVTWMESLVLLNIEFTLLPFLYICKIILIKKAFCHKWPVAQFALL